ncbi:MAG: UDP-N-acetylmuramate dehydrogenase [Candidatus Latescibacterota bacterium]|nr:MAG: UDP-N-acetylmuramate dehydrogenase [Candidatus Latescibacterota bacterium]
MTLTNDKTHRDRLLADLKRICPGAIRQSVSMATHTTIAAGGDARYFAVPSDTKKVVQLVRLAKSRHIPYIAVGRGSNLLVRDGGFDGIVIKIADNLRGLRVLTRTAHAEAGVSFTRLGKVLTREGRPGFEFAVGIPGTVGGAVTMNAGAWGLDIAGVLKSVKIVDGAGRLVTLTTPELGFGYRRSRLPRGSIVLSAIFFCPPGRIDEEVLKRSQSRGDTQPLAQRSFGSTFKNPTGGFAAKMIDQCGLKGTRRGGVMVSEKHANFLVNIGEQTKANDIEDLMHWIVEKVEDRFGVTLQPEVKIIGDR